MAFFEKAEVINDRNEQREKDFKALESKLAEANKTIEARDATIKELQGKLEAAEKAGKEQDVKITHLNATVEAEKKRVDETLASMGVDPKTIPAPKGEKPAADNGEGQKLLAQFNAITDPTERTAFYRKNKEKIMVARFTPAA